MKTLISAIGIVALGALFFLSSLHATVYDAQRVGEIARYVVPLTNQSKLTKIIHLEDSKHNVISVNDLVDIQKQFGNKSVLIDNMRMNNVVTDVELIHIDKNNGHIEKSEGAVYLERLKFQVKPDQVKKMQRLFPNATFNYYVTNCPPEFRCFQMTVLRKT